jgi:hypothetical protein
MKQNEARVNCVQDARRLPRNSTGWVLTTHDLTGSIQDLTWRVQYERDYDIPCAAMLSQSDESTGVWRYCTWLTQTAPVRNQPNLTETGTRYFYLNTSLTRYGFNSLPGLPMRVSGMVSLRGPYTINHVAQNCFAQHKFAHSRSSHSAPYTINYVAQHAMLRNMIDCVWAPLNRTRHSTFMILLSCLTRRHTARMYRPCF